MVRSSRLRALAVLAAAAGALAGCGGSSRPPARPVADVPPAGLAPGSAWYVRRTYSEPLDGDAPEAGRRWRAALPVRAETWTAAGGHPVLARVVVTGPARFASEGDRLAYLASGSDDAAIRPGTVLQDGVTAGATGRLAQLGLAADVGAFPARPTRGAVRGLEDFTAAQHTIRPTSAIRLAGVGEVLAIAPVPAAYRRALVAYARALPGVRSGASGGAVVLATARLRLVVDARTGALRDATGETLAPGRVEVASVVAAAGERPARGA